MAELETLDFPVVASGRATGADATHCVNLRESVPFVRLFDLSCDGHWCGPVPVSESRFAQLLARRESWWLDRDAAMNADRKADETRSVCSHQLRARGLSTEVDAAALSVPCIRWLQALSGRTRSVRRVSARRSAGPHLTYLSFS